MSRAGSTPAVCPVDLTSRLKPDSVSGVAVLADTKGACLRKGSEEAPLEIRAARLAASLARHDASHGIFLLQNGEARARPGHPESAAV